MLVEVAFLPVALRQPERKVCVMIDVLRASTTMVAMFDRSAPAIRLAESAEAALALAARGPNRPVVAGEVGGLPPAGFDLGNSPAEALAIDFAGREIVYCTSNGTRALRDLAVAPLVVIGGLRNRRAVTLAAHDAAARRGLDLAFVCAGRALGTNFGLDDLFCAGAMIEVLASERGLKPGSATGLSPAALISGSPAPAEARAIHESATAAWRIYHAYGGDARPAFAESGNGQALEELGLWEDLAICADVDRSRIVPRLEPGEPLRVVAASGEGI